MFQGGSLFKTCGVVKALDEVFLPPGLGGDVVHNVAGDFFGNHAEHADIYH